MCQLLRTAIFAALHGLTAGIALAVGEAMNTGAQIQADQFVATPANGGEFAEALRAQTRMTWPLESELLLRHVALSRTALVADICCGVGDFAARLQGLFPNIRITAIDSSDAAIALAKQGAAAPSIEYLVADATRLPFANDEYDLVLCRHALQVMPKPLRDGALREITRICRPGGTVYITNEKNSLCYGSPGDSEIADCYRMVADICQRYGMDIECGPEQGRWLRDVGLVDVKNIPWIVSSDVDPDGFSTLIACWEDVFLPMARSVALREDELVRMRLGFAAHRRAAAEGHAGWPIWSSIGRKPFSHEGIRPDREA